MNSKYSEIYKDIYDRPYFPYPYLPPFPPHDWDASKHENWEALHKRLLDSIKQSDDFLREDAKAFLFLNMSTMVILPIIIAGDSEARQVLDKQLAEDIETLVVEARNRSQDERSISAHALIDALAGSWEKLKTMELRVWGASGEQEEYENG